jgi:cyclopropane fatty-acyl-phospholipid synthase-like methyltransferase
VADPQIDSRVWQSIDYRPAIASLTPESLLPYLAADQTALDVGCNTGKTSLWLARQGVSVTGIDINADALETARCEAVRAGLQSLTSFKLADITCDAVTGPFDIVVLIRVLTCIPAVDAWKTVLNRVHALLPVGGFLYVHDFLRDDRIAHYRQRYREAELRGWRSGNFSVNDAQGELLFVAHHHSQEELEQMAEPYIQLDLSSHLSRSMNGNDCRMFRFLGRKR